MVTEREALRLALEALDCIYSPLHVREINKVGSAMTAIREALAQPEQEPVAWTDMAYARLGMVRDKMSADAVATVQGFLEGNYTTPPQRKPLTDEEIAEMMVQIWSNNNIPVRERSHRLARAIEASHGIKE